MTAALFYLAPAPQPAWVPVPDDIRSARRARYTVSATGRIARVVAVSPRCRFGSDEESEPSPPTAARPSLRPIPPELIERLPPGMQPAKRFVAPAIVRIGRGFDAEQPVRGTLDPLALATARRITPVGIDVVCGLMNDAGVNSRKHRAKRSDAPPPRLMVLGQLLALTIQSRLKLAPSHAAINGAARDAIRLLGYRRAEVTSTDRARELKQRTSEYLRLRQGVENVLRTLFVEGRTAYRAIANAAFLHADDDGNEHTSARTMQRNELSLSTEDRQRLDRLATATERAADRLEMLLAYESRPRSPGVLRLHPTTPEPHDHKPH